VYSSPLRKAAGTNGYSLHPIITRVQSERDHNRQKAPSYQNLHRELLLSHKRGLLLEEKPELKRVLEQRRLERHKEEEMARQGPSDLEMELRKRQQKLQEEEIRQRENQQKIPEFVRVRDNLRRTQTFDQP
uniref:Zgc:195245 n=1 Tax=Oryzias sinensis TaxID=183150 RepID=A0A8C7ZB84_9TELE